MNLHLISQSPFSTPHPVARIISDQDALLLIGDGCYYLQNIPALTALKADSKAPNLQIFVLSEDCTLRGLHPAIGENEVTIDEINTDDFVNLSLNAKHIINW